MTAPTGSVPQQPIRYDFDTLRAGAQAIGQFGQVLKQMGGQFKQIHQQLKEHCSGDESGIGGAIEEATSDSAEAAGTVFSQGGRVLSEMGARVQGTSDRTQSTDQDITDAFNSIGGEQKPSSSTSGNRAGTGATDTEGTSGSSIPLLPDDGAVHLAGAGGPWSTVDEQPGGAVGQSTENSCVSASGEKLSNGALTQDQLISAMGDPASLEQLRDQFNQAGVNGSSNWKAGALPSDDLYRALTNRGDPFIAELKVPQSKIAHAVVVTGGDDDYIHIADPADGGTSYKMTWADFLQWRSGRVMFNG